MLGGAKEHSELLAIVVSLRDAGVKQEALVFELSAYAAQLRESDEEREDEVLEILDCVVGWCWPDARLFP